MKNYTFQLIIKYFCLFAYLLSAGLLHAQSDCVNDTIAPIANCNSNFSIEVFDSTIAKIIHAKVLNDGSFDNCTPDNELHFAFSENPTDTIYTIPYVSPCAQLKKRRRFIDLFVFDKNGLSGSCRTSFIIHYRYPCIIGLDTIYSYPCGRFDSIPPNIYCKPIGVAFIKDTIELEASYFNDYDDKSQSFTNDNCSNEIKFSFSPDSSDNLRRVTRADLNKPFQIYATDEVGNQSNCTSNIYALTKTRIRFNYFHDLNLNCQLDEGEEAVFFSEIKDTFKFLDITQTSDHTFSSSILNLINPSNIYRAGVLNKIDGSIDIYYDSNNLEINEGLTISPYVNTTTDFQEFVSLLLADDFRILQVGAFYLPFLCDYEFDLTAQDLQQDSIVINLPIYLSEAECPLMFVDIGTPFIRRCFDNTYIIQYCNYGLETAKDAYIDLSFDENLELVSSEKDYELLDNQQIRIHLGDVPSAFCDRFQMTFNASCEAPLGATHCVEAKIFPDTLCTPPTADWSGAAIEVTGNCLGDSIQFQIKNVGDGDMLDPTKFIVIEDVILRQEGEVQLLAQEAMQFSLPANGASYRMQAEQVPNYPYPSVPIASIEGCGVDENGNQSFGFVNQFPTDDLLPSVSMDCQQNRGAFDPNDKQVIPAGTGEQHYTEKNIPLKYKIRFQNTGTDTAFTVIIRDTLSEHLNPTTLSMGSSNHPYDFLLLENKILVVRFQDILLPDSTINEAKSHGFIEFEINQTANLPDGTTIQNQAAIYFDFNEPIITNRVFNTIGIPFSRVIANTSTPQFPDYEVVVMPNPFHNQAIIELKGAPTEGTVSIFNTLGQKVQQLRLQDNRVEFIRNGVESGIYFYQISTTDKQLVASGMMSIVGN